MRLTDLTLLSLQTAFMQRDLTTQGMCAGLQGELRDIATETYNILMYQSLSTLQNTTFGNQLLDELAWQFHVDYYDKEADFNIKKNMVKQSIRIHQKKGTPQAVIEVLETAFPSDTLLLEWFDYGGKPYHFKIITSEIPQKEGETQEQAKARFISTLNTVKNARSYLEELSVFTNVLNYALNNIRKNLEISYEPVTVISVGDLVEYTFPNGETLQVGDENKVFSFYE